MSTDRKVLLTTVHSAVLLNNAKIDNFGVDCNKAINFNITSFISPME